MNTTFQVLKDTYSEWSEDKAPRLAAALAYYAMFALAPLLIIVIAIAGLVFGEEAARGQIVDQIRGLVGENGGQAIEGMIVAASKPSSGIIATVIGLVTLVLAAGGLFGQLQDALNTIWEVAPKPGMSFWEMIKARFVSFTMVLGVGFLLLISLVISAGLAAFGKFIGGDASSTSIIWQIVNLVISIGVTALLFALIFKVLPDAEIQWGDVWIGALATALLFTLGRFLIGLYLARTATESAYGAAGSLVIVLIWIYYSAQILFFGAEFTQVYARTYGSRIVPSENAVPLTEEARAQQGMPRRDDQGLRERQVGGEEIEHTAAEPPPRADSRLGLLASFLVGLVIGRRNKRP